LAEELLRKAGEIVPKKKKQTEERPIGDAPVPVVLIQLRSMFGERSFSVPEPLLAELAMQWSYVVRNRARWTGSSGALDQLSARARLHLEQLKIDPNVVTEMTQKGVLEISIPFSGNESEHWAARIMPWEIILRVAVNRSDLIVVRHLNVSAYPDFNSPSPEKLVFVASAPGRLANIIDFQLEKELVTKSLTLPVDMIENPSLNDLANHFQIGQPEYALHLSGVDRYQGEELLPDAATIGADERRDGFYFASEPGAPLDIYCADPEEIGLKLNQAKQPVLVVFNAYNSASRLAAMAVARGAHAAIGFLDVFDDRLAEVFFATLYRAWHESNWDLLAALQEAAERVSRTDERRLGAVLWTRHHLISPTTSRPLRVERVADPNQSVVVDIKPSDVVNYARLHNGEGLFEKFSLYRYNPDQVRVRLEVTLYLGTDSFPYEAMFMLSNRETPLDLSKKIYLPLTSRLARGLREAFQTTLRTRVSVLNNEKYEEVYTDTAKIRLLPVNEWKFDEKLSTRWLASFVLPADEAVRKIVDRAQKFLAALSDNATVGFDGYQSVDNSVDDPCAQVDRQVQALWAALSFNEGLSYINPPPVFTGMSQRLRTPTDVIEGRRGTCIDLALLFAACLEYVEIWPVVFVLEDHAFPGYWRDERERDKYLAAVDGPVATPAQVNKTLTAEAQKKSTYDELRRFVQDGSLVPLETVWLTSRTGFAESVEGGLENLNSRARFNSLLDVRRARDQGVTPLPIAGVLE
jgi:hypothetical protein